MKPNKHRFHNTYEPFTCAICEREFDCGEPYLMRVQTTHIPPVCNWCTDTFSPIKYLQHLHGAHKDRRILVQGLALSGALLTHSNIRDYENGRA